LKRLDSVLFMICCLSIPAAGIAQIPNAGFENWTAGSPDGWSTTNLPTLLEPVTQTSSAHSGNWAVMGSVISTNIFGDIVVGTPFINTGFGVHQRYASISGYYTFTSVGGDSLFGYAVLYTQGLPVADLTMGGRTTRSSYQQWVSDFEYFSPDIPDTCLLWFGISGTPDNGDTVHVGSSFKLDDLVVSGVVEGVKTSAAQPLGFALHQNYPNPFNPTTTIEFSIQQSEFVSLKIYDVLGSEVAALVNEVKNPGSYAVTWNAAGLASGLYLYRLQTGTGVQQRKMILQK
jgi:hypothetical protein